MSDMSATPEHIKFDIGAEVNRLHNMIHQNDPLKSVYLAMVHPDRPAFVNDFLATRAVSMEDHNAIARAFRANPRMEVLPTMGELRKSGHAPAMKASLDVGTLTNFAQITGGQSLGYVSLDTHMARGTVRPGSFTLYQALHKTRAFQVVDYWASATDTGGPPPGAAFAGFGSVSSGTLPTSAGLYSLNNITLKLINNGRSITTALAAQNSFVDVASQENINAALTCLETANWASYYGNPTFFPNQFLGAFGQIPAANVIDYQNWYNSYAAAQGWSPQQALFNLIYQWAGEITSYNQFGRITHAFMSPTCAGSLQGVVTTLLNNVVNQVTSHMDGPTPVMINGDLQGMMTRFGRILFPIDLYITARDKPVQAVLQSNGTNLATTVSPTKPATVTATVSGGASPGSQWNAAYVASSGWYTYAVASCDASMLESQLTYATPVSGVTAGTAYSLAIAGPAAGDAVAFRVFRSGLGEQQPTNNALNPASYRYIGTVAASGSGTVTFVDKNAAIPGSETLFLFDLDENDAAMDFRYLLPLTKIELFAQNLFMPWAVAMIGGVRMRIPKFHGVIKNYVGDNPVFNPLTANPNAV
jgi:hypothetical protein